MHTRTQKPIRTTSIVGLKAWGSIRKPDDRQQSDDARVITKSTPIGKDIGSYVLYIHLYYPYQLELLGAYHQYFTSVVLVFFLRLFLPKFIVLTLAHG